MHWTLDALTLTVLGIASIHDIKTREVPDWLSYFLLATGLGASILQSVLFMQWSYFIISFLGFIAMVILACLLYYTGQWGGGDAKLLMGIGSILGLRLILLPTLAYFIIFLFVGGALYGLLWSLILGLFHIEDIRKKFLKHTHEKYVVFTTLFIGIFVFFLAALYLELLSWLVMIIGAFIAIMPLLFFYLKTVETTCFVKSIPVEKLTEGDWVTQPITHGVQTLYTPKKTGITQKDIDTLKTYKHLRATVKSGVPFVPSFLLAYLLLLILKVGGIIAFE